MTQIDHATTLWITASNAMLAAAQYLMPVLALLLDRRRSVLNLPGVRCAAIFLLLAATGNVLSLLVLHAPPAALHGQVAAQCLACFRFGAGLFGLAAAVQLGTYLRRGGAAV